MCLPGLARAFLISKEKVTPPPPSVNDVIARSSLPCLISRSANHYLKMLRLAKHLSRRNPLKRSLSTDAGAPAASEILLPPSADVVVIGGGNAGCNVIYQLARRGVNAVLLERDKLTSGTTWHTSGLVWRLRPSDTDIELLNRTVGLLGTIEAETGLDPGWTNNGGIFIANNKERLDEYKRLSTVGRSFGIESVVLSPEETQKLFPLINTDVIYGSMYSPGDGLVDPTMFCAALSRAATAKGAKIIENTTVKKLLTGQNMFGHKQITGVVTNHGTISTNCIVNCCGVWAAQLAAMARLEIPLIPMKHAYVMTEPINGVRGCPNIRDHDLSTYYGIHGESLAMGGYEYNPEILDQVDNEFSFSLYELDWNIFSTHMRGAVTLIPAFETAGIKTTVCGPESFTPDHKPLVGEDPRLRGMFYSCGFNSGGMQLGTGCGEQVAKWIVNGRPDLNMFKYDIRRFTPDQCRNKEWVRERTHESYANYYQIQFPHDENLAGRNQYKSPFHKKLQEAGCFFEQRQGWERPGWFANDGWAPIPAYDWLGAYGHTKNTEKRYENLLKGDLSFDFSAHHQTIGREALACRHGAALFDLTYYGKTYLCGPEAREAAAYLCSANTNFPEGKTVYTCLLNADAGIEGDVTVTSIGVGSGGPIDPLFKGDGYYIVSGGASAYHTWAHINSVLEPKNFKVTLKDMTDKIGVLSVQGPNSRRLLESIVEADLSDEAFPYGSARLVRVAGQLCRVIRVSFVGELGWEIHIPNDKCLAVYKAVQEAGTPHGLKLAGFRALYSLSCEKGYHLWDSDARIDDNPIEAGLGFTLRKSGKYLGKKAIDKIVQSGRVKKRRVFFQLKEQVPIWGMETILRDDEVVGFLRRGEYGYFLNGSIGIGYVTHPGGVNVTDEFLASGKYEIEVMGERHDAQLFLKSPFDPKNKRIHGNYN